jgi:hypothetical protein
MSPANAVDRAAEAELCRELALAAANCDRDPILLLCRNDSRKATRQYEKSGLDQMFA